MFYYKTVKYDIVTMFGKSENPLPNVTAIDESEYLTLKNLIAEMGENMAIQNSTLSLVEREPDEEELTAEEALSIILGGEV